MIDCGTGLDGAGGLPAPSARRRPRAVSDGRAERGIVLGGSGQGEQIVANKIEASARRCATTCLHSRASRESTTTRTSWAWGLA